MNKEALFHRALEMSPDERAAFLDQACGGNAVLRRRVEDLLRAHDSPGSFMVKPAAPPEATVVPDPGPGAGEDKPAPREGEATGPGVPTESAGGRVGPYRLLQQIGEGGMGAVFMAEQTQPVRRRVALKVIKPGMDTRQVIARFEAERQALALMDHPNIAKVLDAGTTASGRPFFVMELVHGVPITKYCDERRLTPRQRLELFVPVCRAVQHAHQKGVIHRDLKPSNVLVALYDSAPVPKVIDFGVAKATGQRLTERTLFTEFGAVVGTLEYMSPEQAELNQLDIDTRSDVYALGVLLYELLTGTTPLERQRAKAAGLLEALRIIREEETQRPSARLSTVAELPAIAAKRGLEPKQLSGLVRGELDWVVMKCLEKDRNRRYETANGLARDLERYLADEPVLACPPTPGYRLRKFVRRNKRALTTLALLAVMVLLALVGSVVGLVFLWQEQEKTGQALAKVTREEGRTKAALTQAKSNLQDARRQYQRAQVNLTFARRAANTFFTEVVEHWWDWEPHREHQQRAFLQKALTFYQMLSRVNSADPVIRHEKGKAFRRLGDIEYKLGRPKKAFDAYRQGIAVLKTLVKNYPASARYRASLAICYQHRSSLFREAGHYGKAEADLRRAIALLGQLAKECPSEATYRADLGADYLHLGLLFQGISRVGEAEKAICRGLDLLRPIVAKHPKEPGYQLCLVWGHHGLGRVFQATDRPRQAERAYRRAAAFARKLVERYPLAPSYQADLAGSYTSLALLLSARGEFKGAEDFHRRAVRLLEKVVANFSHTPLFRTRLAEAQNGWAKLLRATNRPREAAQQFRHALANFQRLAADFPRLAPYQEGCADHQGELGNVLIIQRRFRAAEKALRRSLELYRVLRTKVRDDREYRFKQAIVRNDLGRLLQATWRFKKAEDHYGRAVSLLNPLTQGASSPPEYRARLAACHQNLGDLFGETRRAREAEQAYRRCLALRERLVRDFKKEPDYQSDLGAVLNDLSMLLLDQGRLQEARSLLQRALTLQQAARKARPWHPRYRLYLRYHYWHFLKVTLRLRDHAATAKAAVELPQVWPEGGVEHCRGAAFLSCCAALVQKDLRLPEKRRQELAKSYGDRAVELLRQGVAKGFRNSNLLRKDPAFQPLRSRSDFQKLLAEMKGNPSNP
jgi:serine/threonine protein kinase/tetratricopeptide (TPR) repeat protein